MSILLCNPKKKIKVLLSASVCGKQNGRHHLSTNVFFFFFFIECVIHVYYANYFKGNLGFYDTGH